MHCTILDWHGRNVFYGQGFGMLLMEEAERIAREEHGASKMAVISGESAAIDRFKWILKNWVVTYKLNVALIF